MDTKLFNKIRHLFNDYAKKDRSYYCSTVVINNKTQAVDWVSDFGLDASLIREVKNLKTLKFRIEYLDGVSDYWTHESCDKNAKSFFKKLDKLLKDNKYYKERFNWSTYSIVELSNSTNILNKL